MFHYFMIDFHEDFLKEILKLLTPFWQTAAERGQTVKVGTPLIYFVLLVLRTCNGDWIQTERKMS